MRKHTHDSFVSPVAHEVLSFCDGQNLLKSSDNKQEYPVINGIPILIDRPYSYIAESFFMYTALVKNHEEHMANARFQFQHNTRRPIGDKIIAAMASNNALTKRICAPLKDHVSIDELIDVKFGSDVQLFNVLQDFAYLRRDWCWLPEGEEEISKIVELIRALTNKHAIPLENAVVAGAGLGRIALELAGLFSHIYATDRSFSCINFFNTLQNDDIVFYELNEKNCLDSAAIVKKHTATLNGPGGTELKSNLDKISYFVSDAANLPLKTDSLSAYISVYFTDVVALKLLLPEIKRVLVNGGVFIHIGPLEYFFKNASEMLSADEIKHFFESEGFVTLEEDSFVSTHLKSPVSMRLRNYSNWVFVAKLKKSPQTLQEISENSVLNILQGVIYEEIGSLGKNDALKEIRLLPNPNIKIECDQSLFDLLLLINGERTVLDILNLIQAEYENFDSRQVKNVYDGLRFLLKNNVIAIT